MRLLKQHRIAEGQITGEHANRDAVAAMVAEYGLPG